ncbi:MAG: zinc ribbon domain-containing protein [Candidatus Aminicenantes bacterium]|nr:zinc ribbon domain-containing protein [Candidatus Aminicenantes bacterium]
MPTYEYRCERCGSSFERRQSMTEPPVEVCPGCGGPVRRIVTGGAGFIIKGSGSGRAAAADSSCSLERSGTTCCGRDERCGKPPCRGEQE